jgi:hypothetical protein
MAARTYLGVLNKYWSLIVFSAVFGLFLAGIILLGIEAFNKNPELRSRPRIFTGLALCGGALLFTVMTLFLLFVVRDQIS